MAKQHEWVNGPNRRYVLAAEDIPELEREAGVHEFVNKRPREEAEDEAYSSYRRKHHIEAAAHHLAMMRAAGSSGSYNDAKKHKLVYDLHIQQLGYAPDDHKIPDEIGQLMQDPHKNPGIKFKAHKGDAFLLNKSEPLAPQVNPWEYWENEYPQYDLRALWNPTLHKSEARFIELAKSDSPLAVNFMTNKLRQLRDLFDENEWKSVSEGKVDETLRQKLRGTGVPRDYAGNFNRDAIQRLIDHAPSIPYNWSTGKFDRAVGATQRHSDELSNVLRLEITPEIERKIKDAGLWSAFTSMQNLSQGSGHPSTDKTAGWVRWTGGPEGIHLDELQSDFGRPWPGMLAEAARRGDFGHPIAEPEIPGFIDNIARQHNLQEDKRKLIQKILFGNKHPGEFLHEAFNAWARGPGQMQGAPLHVWQPEAKLWIANRDEDPRGHFDQTRPIPGHMQVTYRDTPVKRGMEEGKYGEIPTQKNPSLKRMPSKKKVNVGNVGEDILWTPSNKTYKDVVRGDKETKKGEPPMSEEETQMVSRITNGHAQRWANGKTSLGEASKRAYTDSAVAVIRRRVAEKARMSKGSLEAKLGRPTTDHIAAQVPVGTNAPNPPKPAVKAEKPYTGRDEGIRRSKLPPGAPGADKAGVGVTVDKKKQRAKEAARKWKPGQD